MWCRWRLEYSSKLLDTMTGGAIRSRFDRSPSSEKTLTSAPHIAAQQQAVRSSATPVLRHQTTNTRPQPPGPPRFWHVLPRARACHRPPPTACGELDLPEPFREHAQYWLAGDERQAGRPMGRPVDDRRDLIARVQGVYAEAASREHVENILAVLGMLSPP